MNPTTVTHDGLANTLTGDQDLDWFLDKAGLDTTDAGATETSTHLV